MICRIIVKFVDASLITYFSVGNFGNSLISCLLKLQSLYSYNIKPLRELSSWFLGCPCNLDPIEVVRKFAAKGIKLYCVGCEPSVTRYRDFFMAVSEITGVVSSPYVINTFLIACYNWYYFTSWRFLLLLQLWLSEVKEAIHILCIFIVIWTNL